MDPESKPSTIDNFANATKRRYLAAALSCGGMIVVCIAAGFGQMPALIVICCWMVLSVILLYARIGTYLRFSLKTFFVVIFSLNCSLALLLGAESPNWRSLGAFLLLLWVVITSLYVIDQVMRSMLTERTTAAFSRDLNRGEDAPPDQSSH